jgi:predicted Rdx family selenoprotein
VTSPADATRTCARPGCDRPLVRKARGRPPLYCSAACRHLVARKGPAPHLVVEVDHEREDGTGRPTGHVWLVRLRRGDLVVEVARDLGRPSADYLAQQLRELIDPSRRAEGGAMG